MASITIALDAMSGDHGLSSVIPAAFAQLKKDPELHLILVGQQTKIEGYLKTHHLQLNSRISICHASEVVTMDELPAQALRNKKDSSLRVAIELVKDGRADAIVSAGNTGALMATARFVLKMLPGINRPAVAVTIPTITDRHVKMLDMGANVNCTAEQLLQFALMGSIVCETIEHIDQPKVSLLNIGAEEIKGNELVKNTAKLIQENASINYVGFIEGDDIFRGEVDVIVCDGFVGNIVLKASEGIADMILQLIKRLFMKNLFNRFCAALIKPILRPLRTMLNPEAYNGSCLLGLKGVVIKSHGSANANAFYHAVGQAKLAVQQNLVNKIEAGLYAIGHAVAAEESK